MLISKKYKNSLNSFKMALKIKHLIFAIFIGSLLFNTHCASVQQPMGGPKDSIPPKILNETPANLTSNFKSKEVVIEFDEFIKLQNEFKEISVTPDMEKLPLYQIKKRSLVITLPDTLEENTTYTINFGKAIGDYNEGNPLLNYSYVFATGDQIDSLNVSGTVTNALTLEKEKETTVMLIPTRQDSIFGKRKANIFTLTDSAGNFTIRNLKEDTYRIYALKEKDDNRIFNGSDEEIGFLPDSFLLNKDTSNIKLATSRPVPKTLRLLDRKIEKNGTVTFVFNRPLIQPELEVVSPSSLNENKIVNYNRSGDSVSMWLSEMTFDSLKVHIKESNELLDSTTIRRSKNEKYDRDLIITDNINSQKVNRVKHIVLNSTAPIKSFNKQNILLTEDSIPRNNYQLIQDTSSNQAYLIRYNWRPKRNYQLELKENAFQGYFGEKSKAVTRTFTLDETENFGDIILKINVPDTIQNQYLVQITNDKKDNLFLSQPISKSERLVFKQFPGGKYLIRIVYDANKNGKWDPADVENKILPEKVWYHSKNITVRPNWEQEEVIDIPMEQTPTDTSNPPQTN